MPQKLSLPEIRNIALNHLMEIEGHAGVIAAPSTYFQTSEGIVKEVAAIRKLIQMLPKKGSTRKRKKEAAPS